MIESIKAGSARTAMVGSLVMAGLVAGLFAPASATTDPVETQMTELGTKVTTYGGLMLGVAVLGIAIALGVKYLLKAKSAA